MSEYVCPRCLGTSPGRCVPGACDNWGQGFVAWFSYDQDRMMPHPWAFPGARWKCHLCYTTGTGGPDGWWGHAAEKHQPERCYWHSEHADKYDMDSGVRSRHGYNGARWEPCDEPEPDDPAIALAARLDKG